MTPFSRILCVVDPTRPVQPAMTRAAWLAKRSGATIDLLICYYNEYLSGDRFLDSAALSEERDEIIKGYKEKLETMANPLRDDGLTMTTTAVWDHPLHEGIVRQAVELEADVVFKDTHHHSALSRTLFTNTDWNLIRTCPSHRRLYGLSWINVKKTSSCSIFC